MIYLYPHNREKPVSDNSGFDLSQVNINKRATASAPPFNAQAAGTAAPQESLNMVVSAVPAQAGPVAATPAAPSGTSPAAAAAERASLAEIGAPADSRGLTRIGAQRGLIKNIVLATLTSHPAALRMLLNNKTLVDAYFSREASRRHCSSGAALKSYLLANEPDGAADDISYARTLLSHPQAAASAIAGTAFAQRMMACPSVSQLTSDPGAMLQIVMANPNILPMVASPAAMSVLSADPRAAAILGGVQSSLGVGAQPSR